jgi:hypothetical protein
MIVFSLSVVNLVVIFKFMDINHNVLDSLTTTIMTTI